MYLAHARGLDVHVWVDETRPRNQGSQLTAWELAQNGVPHTVVVDNAGGHLMQHGMVDICITGTDRTTRAGDVANKIGTYLKALAAADNGVPFYVALPSTTIDWTIDDGLSSIPIEERDPSEVSHVHGRAGEEPVEIRTIAPTTAIRNFAFDVTPARLITGLITERGVCEASEAGLAALFPSMARQAS
jgi:methylthioribose-1-phosphate isomerase